MKVTEKHSSKMSLASFLQVPAVKARFKQDWPVPTPRPQRRSWAMVAPPISPRPQLIGAAFDYVLRFYLRRLNPSSEERGNWVAESAVTKLKGSIRELGQDICETARTRYQLFLNGEPFHDDLLASTLQLAQLDFIFRTKIEALAAELETKRMARHRARKGPV